MFQVSNYQPGKTNGRGVDYVLEVGGEGTLVKSLSSLKIGGHILIIGFLAGVSF